MDTGLAPNVEMVWRGMARATSGRAMQAVEIVADETAGDRTPDPALAGRAFEAARQRGLLLGKGGRFGNVFRIAPPMLVTADEIDRGVRILGESLAAAGAR